MLLNWVSRINWRPSRLRGVFSSRSVSKLKMENGFNTYEEAILMLNKLQSNTSALKDGIKAHPSSSGEKLKMVEKYLARTGINSKQIESLPVLHVSGTKGKGSTCAFCESILRHHGYKTGFFSSPHLIEVRERIRINGVPISKSTFSEYFWRTFNDLDKQKETSTDIAFYFQFLFIMAIHIFLQNKVDVAIIEVGIGGEYDPTNIVRNVPVAGITSLGYDHTSLLGNTIESIAWNKAGIMKKDSSVFTVAQPREAHDVLHKRSIERKCTLTVVQNVCYIPCIQTYPPSIQTNINLAIRLAEAWMLKRPKHPNNNSLLDLNVLRYSIENFVWPGRYEIRQEKNIRFYIDGAHTVESMALCVDWYLSDVKNRPEKRGLIFNLTGKRSFETFFNLLGKCDFETVMFVPNIAKSSGESADNLNLVTPADKQLSNCHLYRTTWIEINKTSSEDVHVFPSIENALEYLKNKGKHNILVTGSLHLVGAALSLLNSDSFSNS